MEKDRSTYRLPDSWVWTTIGDIGVLSSGGTPSRRDSNYFNGDIPWVKSGELNHNIIEDTEEKITQEALDSCSAKVVPAKSLLIALYGSTVGKVGTLGVDAATNQAVAAIITFKCFNQRFLYYYLINNREVLLQKRKGGAQPNISQKILSEFKIPIAPLPEQNHIIYKIEALFSELDHAEKGLKKAKHQLGIYRQALLKSAFEGKLTEEWRKDNPKENAHSDLKLIQKERKDRYELELENAIIKKPKPTHEFTFENDKLLPTWVIANLENLIGIHARIGWRGLTKKEYTAEGPLFLSVHSLNFGKNVVFKDAFHISKERYEESPEIKLKVNDILLCKDGAGIGKIGVIKYLPSEASVNSSLLVIDSKEVFNPDFLYYFFSGPTMQKLVSEKIAGSAIPHLFQKDIKKFDLKVPPKKEQDYIVEMLESRFTLVQNLADTISNSLTDIRVFKQAILKKAFEGRLVNQDRNDESAQGLLQRIQIEKEAYLKAQKELAKLKPKKKRQMEIKKTALEILKETENPISTHELWQKSIHEGDIESFYTEIKEIYNQIEEVKNETERFLILRK